MIGSGGPMGGALALAFASVSDLLGVEVEEEVGFWPEVVDVGLGRGGRLPLNGMERKAGSVWKKRVGKVVPKNAPINDQGPAV
jgi:hypothetical protein